MKARAATPHGSREPLCRATVVDGAMTEAAGEDADDLAGGDADGDAGGVVPVPTARSPAVLPTARPQR
jgi:hypothetical protein